MLADRNQTAATATARSLASETLSMTSALLVAWEARRGISGILLASGKIRRKCADCAQPTRALSDAKCPKHGKKRKYNTCERGGCTNVANRANGTLCKKHWVANSPEQRACPQCKSASF